MKNPWLFPAAALALGAVGGYLSGKSTSAPDSTNASLDAAARSRSVTRAEVAGGAELGKKSRASSMDQIAKMPGNSARIQALMDFYAGLSPEQLAEEATKLDALPMGERIMASFLLFGRWAEVDPTAAMAFSNTMGMAGGFVRPTILQNWASVDPANAAQYYQDNPREFSMMDMMGGRGPMGGQGGASIIAAEWARQDPAAALAWANSLKTGKGEALTAVIGEVAKTDPQKAAGMLAGMTPEERKAAYPSVASQFGANNFAEAQVWVRTLPADSQEQAMASAISGLATKDPNEAATQFKLMKAGEAKDDLLPDVVKALVASSPQAAGELIKSQGGEEGQRDAMRSLMPTWSAQDPAAALAFADSFKPGPVRDRALEAVIWSDKTTPRATLIKTAETIQDEDDRNRAIGVTAMGWMREDPAAATAYVHSSSLSDEAKQRIISGQSMWGDRGRGRN
jgi:hypothetical protein